jgi:Abnormal spindle-like microcephaly-assoc'd, ASPM-SPD-2-Hydin
VFSSYCACRRGPIRRLYGLRTKLLTISACCLIFAQSGYVANGSATAPPGAITFGVVPVGQTATSGGSLLSESSTLNVVEQNVSVNGHGSLPVTISAGGPYVFDVGFATGQSTATNDADTQVAQARRSRGTRLSALSCSSGSITGSGSDGCAVTLTAAAGSGGLSVSLASSNAAVNVPTTVTVPPNATSVGFTASVSSVKSAQSVTLRASEGSVSKSFALQLNASGAVSTLTTSPASLPFGNVTVNTPTTLPVTLTSTGTAPVTINSGTLGGTGFSMSGATFPVTLSPNLAVTLDVQFDPAATGAATGQLTIQSNSSTNSTAVISLSGTGESAQHQVDLNWQAPSSSTDPIVGYNIYRAPGGSSAYQLLNSSVDAQTTYVDSTVQAGLTYDYIVESVDSSGVESVPSNEGVATVP